MAGRKYSNAGNKKGKRIAREKKDEFRQVEYINCEIEFQDDVKTFFDKQTNNRVIFY